MNREQRDRMTETFVSVGDALRRSVVPVYQVEMRKTPDLARPFYLPAVPQQTASQYRAALGKLGALGIVKRPD